MKALTGQCLLVLAGVLMAEAGLLAGAFPLLIGAALLADRRRA